MEYRQILKSSRTGHRTAPQDIQFTPPPLISRASAGHPAIPPLLFPSLSLSLTAETLDIHWLTLPPASILFHSPWRLSATCCIVISPNPSNHSADALIREYGEASSWESTTRPDCSPLPSLLFSFLLLPLTAETLSIHWLTLHPASILFHSPRRLSATCCIVTPPEPRIPKPPNTPNRSADALIREYGEASGWESTTRSHYSSLPSPLFSFLLLSLPAEILNIHWLILPPASILFPSLWRLSATCCTVIPPSPSNHSADALILTRPNFVASFWLVGVHTKPLNHGQCE